MDHGGERGRLASVIRLLVVVALWAGVAVVWSPEASAATCSQAPAPPAPSGASPGWTRLNPGSAGGAGTPYGRPPFYGFADGARLSKSQLLASSPEIAVEFDRPLTTSTVAPHTAANPGTTISVKKPDLSVIEGTASLGWSFEDEATDPPNIPGTSGPGYDWSANVVRFKATSAGDYSTEGTYTITVQAKPNYADFPVLGMFGSSFETTCTKTFVFTLDNTGPTTSGVSVNAPLSAGPAQLGATIADPSPGMSPIDAAEYFIDTPGTAGQGFPMGPADGMFDSVTEMVTGLIVVGKPGGQTFFVHGRDLAGNWGPFASVAFPAPVPTPTPTPPSPGPTPTPTPTASPIVTPSSTVTPTSVPTDSPKPGTCKPNQERPRSGVHHGDKTPKDKQNKKKKHKKKQCAKSVEPAGYASPYPPVASVAVAPLAACLIAGSSLRRRVRRV